MTITKDEVLELTNEDQIDRLVSGLMGWRTQNPSANIRTIFGIQDEVKAQGQEEEYGKALKKIVKDEDTEGLSNWFLLANATATQRCKALLYIHAI